MTTSNASEPVDTTAGGAASAPETVSNTEITQTTPPADGQAMPVAAAAAVVPEKPAYTPNYKFKAFGKEHELDEFFKPLIKDMDAEKKVKDLFTKAYALDDYKQRFEGTNKEFEGLLKDYQTLDKDVKRVMKFRNDGDLENFFKSVRISDQDLFQYVQNRLEQQNLTPHQRQVLESQAQDRQRLYDMEQEKAELQSQYESQAVQARTMQLDFVMQRQDIAQVANQWDAKMGEEGAFRKLVIEEGQRAWQTMGQDISAETAAQIVLQKWGKLSSETAQPQAVSSAPVAPAAPQPKPVIPALHGKGTSPVKKVPKSIEDIKAMAAELRG